MPFAERSEHTGRAAAQLASRLRTPTTRQMLRGDATGVHQLTPFRVAPPIDSGESAVTASSPRRRDDARVRVRRASTGRARPEPMPIRSLVFLEGQRLVEAFGAHTPRSRSLSLASGFRLCCGAGTSPLARRIGTDRSAARCVLAHQRSRARATSAADPLGLRALPRIRTRVLWELGPVGRERGDAGMETLRLGDPDDRGVELGEVALAFPHLDDVLTNEEAHALLDAARGTRLETLVTVVLAGAFAKVRHSHSGGMIWIWMSAPSR